MSDENQEWAKRGDSWAPAERGEVEYPRIVVNQGRPRFVIEKHAAWRDEWTVVEYAVDLKTATRRMDTLTRTIDAGMRIIDRGDKQGE